MSTSSMLLFAVTLLIAAAAPGPATMTIVARVLGRGSRGTPAFCAGLMVGDLFWLVCAALGAAALAERAELLFRFIKYGGVLYLIYLAAKFWTSRREALEASEPEQSVPAEGFRMVVAGATLGLSNPKTILFYLALLPSVIDLSRLTALDLLALCAVAVVVVGIVSTFYAVAAARARRFFRSAAALKVVDRVSAVVMASAALLIAVR